MNQYQKTSILLPIIFAAASSLAASSDISNVAAVPYVNAESKAKYQEFLAKTYKRAFAINVETGYVGYS